jgi:hypothetical protein
VKVDIVDKGEHPNKYSTIAEADNPAIRLGILIRGDNGNKRPEILQPAARN